MLVSDANVKMIAARLGHTKTAITVDTYAYALQHQDREAAEGVSALLFGSRQPGTRKPAPLGGRFSLVHPWRLERQTFRSAI